MKKKTNKTKQKGGTHYCPHHHPTRCHGCCGRSHGWGCGCQHRRQCGSGLLGRASCGGGGGGGLGCAVEQTECGK